MADAAEDQRRLAVEILTYFVEHKDAVDSLEGISGWRLLGARVRSTVESTQQVLDLLVSRGYIRKIDTASGPLYQINPEKLAGAEHFLRQGDET